MSRRVAVVIAIGIWAVAAFLAGYAIGKYEWRCGWGLPVCREVP